MTLSELIADYRFLSQDKQRDPFATDYDLRRLFKEAEDEAAIRGRLILETENEDVCRIPIVAATASYALHIALFELVYVAFVDGDGKRTKLYLTSTEALDTDQRELQSFLCLFNPYSEYASYTSLLEDWRDKTDTPRAAIQTDRHLRLVPTPDVSGTLHIEGYRTPIGSIGSNPEIATAHHRHLIQWVIYRVFGISDYAGLQIDPERSTAALSEFENYFGRRPDSGLRRETRHDQPHVVEAHII